MTTKEPAKPNLVKALEIRPQGVMCRVARILQNMTPEEVDAIRQAIETIRQHLRTKTSRQSGYTSKWLFEVLNEHQCDVSLRTVDKHVRKECSCGD